jgi:putative membrane-bound dehydrogenase-like protein
MNASFSKVYDRRCNFALSLNISLGLTLLLFVGIARAEAEETAAIDREALQTTVIAEGTPPEPLDINKTPAAALQAMTLAPGFKATVFAAEPHVRQPNAFCIDDRGRLWVGENYTYTKYGWKPDERDRILIFEDTDGDGQFDTRKVFFDDFHYVSGLEVGHGGVWIGSPPNLLFVPDRNRDDIPDGPAEVVLDGWGREDQHETLNTFTWGPDGWLYGCHGVFTHSRVGRPGTPEDQRTPLNAGVWRYHPVRKEFEVFAWGTSNPWGIDFDDRGQLLETACVIPHLWHMIQGGLYHRQAGQHFQRYAYDDIKNIATHTHVGFQGRRGGHAHGGALLYQGENFPAEYRGKLLMCNIHHHNIYVDRFERAGSALVGSHHSELMNSNDPFFLGFNLRLGPEGAVYVIDWYDSQACHGQTVSGQDTGRIYRISYGDPQRYTSDLGQRSSLELAALQSSRNEWLVRHARLNLAERVAQEAIAPEELQAVHDALRKQLAEGPVAGGKLRALWALHVTGGADDALLGQLLSHEDEYLRAWAIQLSLEDRQIGTEMLAQLGELATSDPSPIVRLYLASALQRLPVEARWEIAAGLVAHAEDATDHNLPLMIWYGIEPLVPANMPRALKLAAASKIPLLRQFIARRIAEK